MRKTYNVHIFVLLFIILATGCSNSTAMPIPAGYSRFSPPDGSSFGLQFDYLSTWNIEVAPPDDLIRFSLPLEPTFQDAESGEWKEMIDWAGISITLINVKDSADFDRARIESGWLREIDRYDGGIKLVEDTTTTLDGYQARRIVRTVDPHVVKRGDSPLLGAIIRETYITVLVNEKYYMFMYDVPENKADGEYEKAFEKLIQSVRFLP